MLTIIICLENSYQTSLDRVEYMYEVSNNVTFPRLV